jgi:hypothetical protein
MLKNKMGSKMNYLFRTALLLCNVSFCYAQMSVGAITHNMAIGSGMRYLDLNFANESQNYTSGGITFNYPINLFTQPPCVQVSLQPNSSHPTTETFVAEISTNSSSATMITVYHINAGVVSEAPNGSVTVCLFALADSTGVTL